MYMWKKYSLCCVRMPMCKVRIEEQVALHYRQHLVHFSRRFINMHIGARTRDLSTSRYIFLSVSEGYFYTGVMHHEGVI